MVQHIQKFALANILFADTNKASNDTPKEG
jgi:hypothetical protein